ncbi:uncharacterized protein LOC134834762 [Culicoides brevitarsis]|uniref:uncharacterized protein LOC134834762 n=1 Tax=Culicoides brevitarsis TaxID=469753 RepID=UPI00307C1C71
MLADGVHLTTMPPLLPVQHLFSLPNPPTDPAVHITDLDRKAVDLIALKHPSSNSQTFVEPVTFAALSLHHVKAILRINNLCEEYFIPLYYGHLTAAWTIDDEIRCDSFTEAARLEHESQVQMFSLLRRVPPDVEEVKFLGKFFVKEMTELADTTKITRQKIEFHAKQRHCFPARLLSAKQNQNEVLQRQNCILDGQKLNFYKADPLSLTQDYVARVWGSLTKEELVGYYSVYATCNAVLMKSYLVGSFLTMIFATASDNMSSNWYEKRFNTLCSLFPELFIKNAVSTDIIAKYTKLYLRQEIPQEAIYHAFLYSCDLTRNLITENKMTWIISQIHTNSVRAALGLAELSLSNNFLTHSFLSQHIPDDQFKALGILVMEIFRDPFASIVISNRKALRYLYPDLAYLGISASSHFNLYPCKPLGTAVNTKETLDHLMAAIKEISMEIEGARLLADDAPTIPLIAEERRRRSQMSPYEAWELYISKNMTTKDAAFATLMNTLLNTCRFGVVELFRSPELRTARKQVIHEDLKGKLELFGIVVPESYTKEEQPQKQWKIDINDVQTFNLVQKN